VKYYDWDEEKNKLLKKERHISFEEAIIAIDENKIFDIVVHHNQARYPHQKVYIIEINNYVYLVPFVEDMEKYFLKTIIPSRKMTKKYLKGGEENL